MRGPAEELVHYLEQGKVRAILQAAHRASARDGLLLEVCYLYALRVSELVRLRREDYRREAGRLRVTRSKGSRSGEYPVFKHLRPKLDAYLAGRTDHAPGLFAGRQGDLATRTVQLLFDRYAVAGGVALEAGQGVHSLRHSIAVHMLDTGREITDVMEHLGHKDIKSTLIYARVSSRRKAETFEAMAASSQVVIL